MFGLTPLCGDGVQGRLKVMMRASKEFRRELPGEPSDREARCAAYNAVAALVMVSQTKEDTFATNFKAPKNAPSPSGGGWAPVSILGFPWLRLYKSQSLPRWT